MPEDTDFQAYLQTIQEQVSKVKDIKGLQDALRDDKLTENELVIVYQSLGFNSKEELINLVKLQNQRKALLNNKYGLSEISIDLKLSVTEKALEKMKYFNKQENVGTNLRADICETIRKSCITSVAAESAVMHLGCAALDLSVIAGIICHAAAITYQYSAGNNCNSQAELCKRNEGGGSTSKAIVQ
ncbi:MAG: hypothetical protein ABUT20_07755 [Bacteroidota bacterium]